jgi:MmyB-like transcription regulator ligand binding domain
VIAANPVCLALFGPTVVGSNVVRDSLTNPAAAQGVVNWPEVAWAGLDRLRAHQRRAPFDPELQQLVTLAAAALADVPRPQCAPPALLVCAWFRVSDQLIRTAAGRSRCSTCCARRSTAADRVPPRCSPSWPTSSSLGRCAAT